MKMFSKLSALLMMAAAIMMISAGAINAQENFAGKWTFNESKSNLGQAPAGGGGGQGQAQGRGGFRMGASEMDITQQGNTLSVARTRQGRDGQSTVTTEKYDLTGKVSENPAMNNTRKSTVTWSADKKVMTIASTTTLSMQGQTRDMKSTEVWKLSDGGKVLTIESINTTQAGEMKTTLVYDKK
jgi:hypothetical protein